MVSTIHETHRASVEKIVTALQSQPPRVRSALTELQRIFVSSSEQPPAILTACAAALKTNAQISADILAGVRTAHAEWDSYGELERKLYSACVYSTDSRNAITATEPNDITVMLRATPPRVKDAATALRWLNAVTQGAHREAYMACSALLSNPSADHPAVVEAIQTGYRVWPKLDEQNRTLFMACVYASKARAEIARARAAKRHARIEAQTPDEAHRCGNCDGQLPEDMNYCSENCRRDAEAAERPAPEQHTTSAPAPPEAKATKRKRQAAEQRAQAKTVVGELEQQYDEHYRAVVRAIPSAGVVRKNEGTADRYEEERQRARDLDDSRDGVDDLTGHRVTDHDYDRMALRPIRPNAQCSACNLERPTRETHTLDSNDDRCQECQDRDRVPLDVIRCEVAIAAQRPNPGNAIIDTLYGLDAVDVLRSLQARPRTAPALAAA
ncbi:hypothetical protein ACXIZN_41355 [Amycolatopsis sp. TRM77291]